MQALRLIVEGLRDLAQAVEFVQLQVRPDMGDCCPPEMGAICPG